MGVFQGIANQVLQYLVNPVDICQHFKITLQDCLAAFSQVCSDMFQPGGLERAAASQSMPLGRADFFRISIYDDNTIY